MAAAKRTKAQRLDDLVTISSLYARGFTQRQIAAELAKSRPYTLSHKTICRDIKDVIAQWRETMVQNVDDLKSAELLRINEIEREAWREWERSKTGKERTLAERRTGGENPGEKASVTREGQCGDPRYLQVVQKCIEQRCEVLGLDAPTKLEHAGPNGAPIPVQQVKPIEERLQRYADVFGEPQDAGGA